MGRLYLIQLDGRIYSCKHCRSHLANSDELLSRVIASFSSRFFPLLFLGLCVWPSLIAFLNGLLPHGVLCHSVLMGFVWFDCQHWVSSLLVSSLSNLSETVVQDGVEWRATARHLARTHTHL
jgi:hypothetical protein